MSSSASLLGSRSKHMIESDFFFYFADESYLRGKYSRYHTDKKKLKNRYSADQKHITDKNNSRKGQTPWSQLK